MDHTKAKFYEWIFGKISTCFIRDNIKSTEQMLPSHTSG